MPGARPSDLYRLPEHHTPAGLAGPAGPVRGEPEPPPSSRRFPAWVGIAGLIALSLIVAGLVRGTTTVNTGEAAPVDVVSEDQAVAALRLYGAQTSVIDALAGRKQIYEGRGPGDAAAVARRGAAAVQDALDQARGQTGASPLAATYWNAAEHTAALSAIEIAAQDAEIIALLAATHDSLYSGSGAIPLNEAVDRITGTFTSSRYSVPLSQWAQALLEQTEDRNRVREAAQARLLAQQVWADQVSALQPAAVSELVAYLNALPTGTVDALRGHPVAGPALQRLDLDTRQVPADR